LRFVGVTEFNDKGAAAAEMRRLWQWIDAKLEGSAWRAMTPLALHNGAMGKEGETLCQSSVGRSSASS
jgi:hypothetical protein